MDGRSRGGKYLHQGGPWGHVNEDEIDEIDLEGLQRDVQTEVGQIDGGITPESLTDDSQEDHHRHDWAILELACSSPKEKRQQLRWQGIEADEERHLQPRSRIYSLRSTTNNPVLDGEFVDDEYSDQESVFGTGESDFVYRKLFDKFSTAHRNFDSKSETAQDFPDHEPGYTGEY